jgi:hypothetical protein
MTVNDQRREGRSVDPKTLEGYVSPKGTLVGVNGNVFSIIGHTKRALKRAGNPQLVLDTYTECAMSGDYDHAVATSMDFIGEYDHGDEEADAQNEFEV